jgi:hypothetical protein
VAVGGSLKGSECRFTLDEPGADEGSPSVNPTPISMAGKIWSSSSAS